ncbi:hypothetical protein Hs30E_10490 [Lactococcus hodotermopsidis]|uniref:Uncharacterized protein n=2 Tax=Pseudolactococcus hodotermopsidis TaxID=2709157 RepID=A0A6A0BDS8_9LACT|nr:hypothetical protein Hs30E_10490 [Lactococcus hodotermopsidis]
MELKDGKQDNTNLKISTGDTVNYTWIIKIPVTTEDRNLEYSVTVTSEVSSTVTGYDSIFVNGINENDNRLDFMVDTWNFANYSAKPIPLTQEDYDALFTNLSNAERTLIRKEISSGTDGNCYGMAITTILAKTERLSVDRLQSGAANLHAVSKNQAAKSAIGYYYVTQNLSPSADLFASYQTQPEQTKINDLKNLADKVSAGGVPVFLCFYMDDKDGNTAGHAICAYGQESCNLSRNGTTYNSRILIYDNNYPTVTEEAYLYFNDNGDWTIPIYADSKEKYSNFRLAMVTTEMKYIDMFNIETSRTSANSYLTARGNTDLKIEANGTTYLVNQTKVQGGDDVVAYYDIGGAENKLNIVIEKPQSGSETASKVSPQKQGESLNLTAMYDNFFIEANANTPVAIQLDPSGSVEIDGKVKAFDMSLTGNEGYNALPWYTLEVSGESGTNPKMEASAEGYILSGESLKKIKVFASDDATANELSIKTDGSKILISSDGTNLTAREDKDGDGKYETVLSTGHKADPNDPRGGGTGGWTWWKILLAVLGGVAIVATVVLVFLKIKLGNGGTKKNKKSKGDDEYKW